MHYDQVLPKWTTILITTNLKTLILQLHIIFTYQEGISKIRKAPFKTVKLVENVNIIFLLSQYSKIQLFCRMIQMFSATNQPHVMRLKIIQVFLFYKLSWLIILSTSPREFVSKWSQVRTSHISHMTQTDDMIYHLFSWTFTTPFSSSYHVWKLRFQAGVHNAPSKKTVCQKSTA